MTSGRPFPGGTANRGRVVREGDRVRRPRAPGAAARHAYLAHLAAAGFAGAPAPIALGTDTETLTYLPGITVEPPLPPWACTTEAAADVGSLLRGLHDAGGDFDAAAHDWPDHVPARHRDGLVTHNDTHPGNVVFDGGRAVGLIDFDLAEPGGRAWELATAACFWTPMLHPDDVHDDRAGRAGPLLAALFDGYRADACLRAATFAALLDAHDRIYAVIREGAEAGHSGFVRSWRARAGEAARGRAWIAARRADRLS